MASGTRRITSTWLVEDGGSVRRGDFLLHEDGSFSKSKGDEDVLEVIDGSSRLVTRSFQNWHTHMAMVLNKSMGEGLPLMEWLETSICYNTYMWNWVICRRSNSYVRKIL